MTPFQKVSLFLTRLSLGSLFFYAGITKILDPEWTSAGYLQGAKTFPALYDLFLRPDVLPFVDFLNQWGLTLVGITLIVGLFVRFSGVVGAGMMILYYFPILDFPHPSAHAFIVDEHIVYAMVLLFLAAVKAGQTWGLDQAIEKMVNKK